MYTSYFGLKENPFNLTPDPLYLFLSPQHSEALNYLLYGVNEKKGFIVITGGIGTGKTTLCRTFLSSLDDSVDSALVFNSAISDTELLRTIIQEYEIKPGRGRATKKRYVDLLNQFLLKNFGNGRNSVLLIDEAQNLSRSVLEQVRMLSNLETEREKLIQIVLLGQPELEDVLRSPSLRQLNERITVRYHLEPLTREQVEAYIEHRLAVAGNEDGKVQFLPGALRMVHECSGGIPRRINAICDRALLIAYTKETRTIDRRAIRDAARDIGAGYVASPGVQEGLTGRLTFLLALLGCAILMLLGTVYLRVF